MNAKLFPTSIDKNPFVYSVFVSQSSTPGSAPPPPVVTLRIINTGSIRVTNKGANRKVAL